MASHAPDALLGQDQKLANIVVGIAINGLEILS